jgi:hypothetical protein
MRPRILKAYASVILCSAALLSACLETKNEAVSQAVEPAVTNDVEVDDLNAPGGARSPFAPQSDAGKSEVTPPSAAACKNLRDKLAADAASCYRLLPDVEACNRVNANFTKMVDLGCAVPDAGVQSGPGMR